MTVAQVVVGAAGLVGTGLAARLRMRGGRVLAVDRTAVDDQAVPVTITDGTDPEFANLLASHVCGSSRAELYYAAGWVPPLARLSDLSVAAFADVVSANLTAAYAALRAFAQVTRQLDVPAAAVVVTSVGAHRAHRYLAGYDAAKAGVESVVRSFALESGPRLSVRAFALGPLAESATTAADGQQLPALIELVPLGRYACLDEVVEALIMFGSAAFDPTAGHTLIFDGGLSVQLRPVDVERAPG